MNIEYTTTPFDDFQANKDDLLKAFVHWSRKGKDTGINYSVSKAIRRLESLCGMDGQQLPTTRSQRKFYARGC